MLSPAPQQQGAGFPIPPSSSKKRPLKSNRNR